MKAKPINPRNTKKEILSVHQEVIKEVVELRQQQTVLFTIVGLLLISIVTSN